MTRIAVLKYDRSVSNEFLAHFLPSGFASSLLHYAHARYPIDFQLRKDARTGKQWATLYVGLTAVLNVHDKKDKGLALSVHKSHALKDHGWDDTWSAPVTADVWSGRWSAVENYLERIILKVIADKRFTDKEGVVQAAVSAFHGGGARVMLDREVVPSFADTAARSEVRELYSGPLVKAIASANVKAGKAPTSFGMECDALALDADGHLVAIEIKPGDVGSLAWVPAQATMYARVLQHWIDHDKEWKEVVLRSYNQRKELGLIPSGFKLPQLKKTVVPAVAFQRFAKDVYINRMYAVQESLVTAGVGHPGLKFYEVSLTGRLDEHERPGAS